jgi:membrane protease YdiL (CAAX protease family)
MTSPTPSEPRTGPQLYHGAPVTPAAAAKLVAVAIGTIYAVQILLVGVGALDLVASAVADLVVIAGVVWYAYDRKLTLADLGVRRAPARFTAAAVLLGSAMWYLTAWLVALLQPPGDPGKLQQLVEQTPLVPTLIALALLPALAEELVFRGILARTLALRLGPAVGIAISAATFALYHLFPPQIVSTFVLGLVLGLLAVRSRSIVPSIIVHVLNNTVAIVLSRDEVPRLGAWMTDNADVMLPGAVVLVGCGIALGAKAAP